MLTTNLKAALAVNSGDKLPLPWDTKFDASKKEGIYVTLEALTYIRPTPARGKRRPLPCVSGTT